MTLTRRILKLWRSIAQTMKQLLMLFWAAQMVVTHTPHNTLYLAAALDLENNSGRLLNCPCCPNSRCGSRETLARCCCEKSFTTTKRKDFNSPKRRRMPDPVSKTTLRKIFFCGTPHSYQTLTTALTSRATLNSNSNQDISSLEDW